MNIPEQLDGDSAFIGIDERKAPSQLAPGELASGKNIRLRNGVIEPRGGDVLLPMMKTDGFTPWSEAYGAGVISDPAGEEWILIAADGALWRCRPNMPAEQILSDFGYLVDEGLEILVDENNVPLELSDGAAGVVPFFQVVQCFNKSVILRGEDYEPLVMRHLDDGFEYIAQTSTGTGTNAIPGSNFGLFHGNRLLLQNERDQVAASDLLDYTRYSVFSDFRINQGDNDKLIAMAAFGDSDASVLMLKDQSVWRVDNVKGDLSNITLKNITRKYGCVAPFSVVDFGRDIAWLSDRGIVTLGLTSQNESQGTALALSDPMPVTMARLRWDLAAGVVAEYYDNKLYFALPFDEALVLSDTDLVTGSPSYATVGAKYYHVISGLEIGAQYQYTQASTVDVELIEAEVTVSNPETESMNRYQGDVVFTAATTTVSLEGTAAVPVTATLRKVIKSGVNNAVMVYDTVVNRWVSVDEREGLNICRWFKVTYQGKQRLGYVSHTGETRLYEEPGSEDEVISTINPAYIDLIVLDQPKSGETVQIGSGTTVYPDPTSAVNYVGAFNFWGVSEAPDLDAVGANLWLDSTIGYSTAAATQWDAGAGNTVQQLDRGLRVISADATVPALVTYDHEAAASQAITESKRCGRTPGDNPCFYADVMHGDMITTTPVQQEFTTRGYFGNLPGRKHWREFEMHARTWSPTLTVKQLNDGHTESRTVEDGITRNRATYTVNATRYDTTNTNDDHAAALREDYSVVLDDGQTGVNLGTNGVDCEVFQHLDVGGNLRDESWYTQLNVTNTTGALVIDSIAVSAQPGDKANLVRT